MITFGLAVRTIAILAFSMTLPGLSGCTNMNSSFDCPMKAGHHCQSLDQVNASVDQGEFAEDISVARKTESVNTHLVRTDTLAQDFKHHREVLQRVWVAPFEDSEGNYHGASDVFAVMQAGQKDPHMMTKPLSESV